LLELPQPVVDHVQRRAQLVRQQREEIVLETAGVFGRRARLLFLAQRLLEIAVELHVVQRQRGGVGQALQDTDFIGSGGVRPRPVRADGADRVFAPHRHHGQAPHEGGPVCILGNALVHVDVGHHGERLVQHDPAGNTGLHRKPPALPQRADGVFVSVIAVIALAEHEGHAVGAGQRARGLANDGANGDFIPRGRQAGDGIQEGISNQLHIGP